MPSAQRGEDPWVEAYLRVWREASPLNRALAIHYPAANGEAPNVCAVCHFWPGVPFLSVIPEPWPCPTVRELLPVAAHA